MGSLMIGRLAKLAKVGVETIRFYEREGLIDEPPRKESGYRQFPEETVLRVRFIKRAKELGFTLKEIQELLSLRVDSKATCKDVRKRAETKILNIEQKIQTLEKMKTALQRLTTACNKKKPLIECPILEALEDNE
jgi:MerR family mercuric resistance operon transcriptional regulator